MKFNNGIYTDLALYEDIHGLNVPFALELKETSEKSQPGSLSETAAGEATQYPRSITVVLTDLGNN